METDRLSRARRLRGDIAPATNVYDVRDWREAHDLATHGREGMLALVGVLVYVVGRVVGDLLTAPPGDGGLIERMSGGDGSWLGLACALVFALLWRGWATRNLSTVTIDPIRREITLRSRRHDEARGSRWTFDQIAGVEVVSSRSSDAVRIDLGARRLLVRVPRGAAHEMTESLRALAR